LEAAAEAEVATLQVTLVAEEAADKLFDALLTFHLYPQAQTFWLQSEAAEQALVETQIQMVEMAVIQHLVHS
jgi:hypothetical protein